MNLTLTLQSKNSTFIKRLSLRQLVSVFVLMSLIFLVSSRSTNSPDENLARIKLAQSEVSIQTSYLEDVESRIDSQMAVYATQIGALRSELLLLDEKTQLLSDQIKLDLPTLDEEQLLQSSIIIALPQELNLLAKQFEDKQSQLALLEKVYLGLHVEDETKLSGRPLKSGWLSSHFGLRNDPFTGDEAMHKGLDFAGKKNDDVLATGAGVVTWSGESSGYGLLVEIDHGNGLVTRYGHNNKLKVKTGDVVTKGDVLAAMGNTGRSTGVHVHYEVLKHGKQVNPVAYLK